MKKLLVLGLMLSLFTFSGSKEEVKTTYAADQGTSATFPSGSIKEILLASDAKDVVDEIVNITISKDEKITLPANETSFTVSIGDGITAYIFKTDSTETDPLRYNCVLNAYVETIYANEDSSYMFADFTALESIDISLLNTSKVINMSWMFGNCMALTNLDLSKFNTSIVENMSRMFQRCETLTTLNLSSFNTQKVTSMFAMFTACSKLQSITFGEEFDTSQVSDMSMMFGNCKALTSLDLSNFKTSNVVAMMMMFRNCNSLMALDVSMFDTSQVSDMKYMFEGCATKELNLSNFDMSKVRGVAGMFDKCAALERLYTPKIKILQEGIPPIVLPAQFETYCGVSQLTSDNLAEYDVLDIVCSQFIDEWKTLRDSNNSICNALIPGSAANDTLIKLLGQYKDFDDDRKKLLDNTTDYESASIGDSIRYLQNVIDGHQSTEGNYGRAKEDSGSFMTLSIKEESPYLVAVITLIGVLSIAGYYFYNKKRQAM